MASAYRTGRTAGLGVNPLKFRLITAALVAVLAGGLPVVRADVGLFPHAHTGIESTGRDGAGADDADRCATCPPPAGSSEDLGNGLKAIALPEFRHDPVSAYPYRSLGHRDHGLSAGGDALKAESLLTVYASRVNGVDPFSAASLRGHELGLREDSQDCAREGLRDRNGAAVLPGGTGRGGPGPAGFCSPDSGGEGGDPYAVGVSYASGGIIAYADYQADNAGATAEGGNANLWRVGGGYALGMFGVYGQYEDGFIADPAAATAADYDLTAWKVGASATFGNTMAYLGYGQGVLDQAGTGSNDYSAWALELTHSLDKHTLLYTGVKGVNCDVQVMSTLCRGVDPAGGEDDRFSLGMQHRF